MQTAAPVSDDNFALFTSRSGMASPAQIDQARKLQASRAEQGVHLSLPDALINSGAITPAQRQAVEKRMLAQNSGGIQQLGNYKLLKKLGEGGMGAVYLAEDLVAQRKVALKVLPIEHSSDASSLSRFRREAKAIGKLNHVNVIGAFAIDEDMGFHYYVMEYCQGEPLDAVLKREKQLSIPRAMEIMQQAVLGLQHAHAHSIIHRDMKPANIFITSDNVVKILDLGLSKNVSDSEQSFTTQSGVILGTPHYISPEQALGERDVDGRTDIYSLGATLYHLVTGQTPFNGSSAAVVLTKHLNEQLPNPKDLRPDIPDSVVQLIQKMMAKKPVNRYPNCDELLEDVERIIAGQALATPALDPALSSVMSATQAASAIKPPRRTGQHAPVRIATSAHAPVSLHGSSASLPKPARAAQNSNAMAFAGLGVAGAAVLLLAAMMLGGDKKSAVPVKIAAAQDKPAVQDKPAAVPMEKSTAAPLPAPSASKMAAPIAAPMAAPATQSQNEPQRIAPESRYQIHESSTPGAQTPSADTRTPHQIMRQLGAGLRRLEERRAEEEKEQPGAKAPVGTASVEDSGEKAKAQYMTALKDALPKARGRFNDAMAQLKKKAEEPASADARPQLEQALADVQKLREGTLEEIKKAGKPVKLKMGMGEVVAKEQGLSLKISSNGGTAEAPASSLDPQDIETYGPRDPASKRTLGLMYALAGDSENARKQLTGTPGAEDYLALLPDADADKPAKTATTQKTESPWIDLLGRVDMQRDRVSGGWDLRSDGLTGKSEGGYERSRLRLPYQPPEEYDLRTVFTTKTEAWGGISINLVLAKGDKQFTWMMNQNAKEGQMAFLKMTPLQESKSAIAKELAPEKVHTCEIQVRKTFVRALVDNAQISEVPTNYHDVMLPYPFSLKDDSAIGLGCGGKGIVRFEKVEVRDVTGKGAFLTDKSDRPDKAERGDKNDRREGDALVSGHNILERIDEQKMKSAGWRFDDGGLVSAKKEYSRVEVSGQLPEDYEVTASFTRVKGDDEVVLLLAYDGHPFTVGFGGNGGSQHGFFCREKARGCVINAEAIKNERRYTVQVRVEKERLQVKLDEKEVFSAPIKRGEKAGPEKDNFWRLSDKSSIGIGSNKSVTVFHKLMVTDLTDGKTAAADKDHDKDKPDRERGDGDKPRGPRPGGDRPRR